MIKENDLKTFFDNRAEHWDEDPRVPHAQRLNLLRLLPLTGCTKILDVACGTGVITGDLQSLSGGSVHGIDIAPKMIEMAKSKYPDDPSIDFEVADFYDYQRHGYDMAVIYDSYPHFTEPERLALSLERSLVRNGCFAIVIDMGRSALDECHAGLPAEWSRSLKTPQEEAIFFKKSFKLVFSKDGESCFVMVFRRFR